MSDMNNSRAFEEFSSAISGFPETMVPSLTYIARATEPTPYIIKARVNFHGRGTEFLPKLFVSRNIVAGRFLLSDLGLTALDVVQAALEGSVATPQGEFAFIPQATNSFAAAFIPLHPELLAQHTRTGVLQIRGTDQADHWLNPLLDWTLRSAEHPYDNLNELSIDFGMGALNERATIIEAVAASIVAVDLSKQITGEVAKIGILATKGLDRSKVSLGYRIIDKGEVKARASINGNSLHWAEEETRDVGSTEISVPVASLVNCYARYDDVTYHSGFILDPIRTPNPRRSVYERFDVELKDLQALLSTKDKKYARDLETASACLLWMLGFNSCHLGGTKVLQNGPDIVGMTPDGNVIVVECTVGTLKADSKMPKLLSRCVAVNDQLAKAGHSHLRVLPVMITTLPRDEIASELAEAVSNGVYVIAGDDFDEAIARTLFPPDANRLFVEAENSLQSLGGIINDN